MQPSPIDNIELHTRIQGAPLKSQLQTAQRLSVSSGSNHNPASRTQHLRSCPLGSDDCMAYVTTIHWGNTDCNFRQLARQPLSNPPIAPPLTTSESGRGSLQSNTPPRRPTHHPSMCIFPTQPQPHSCQSQLRNPPPLSPSSRSSQLPQLSQSLRTPQVSWPSQMPRSSQLSRLPSQLNRQEPPPSLSPISPVRLRSSILSTPRLASCLPSWTNPCLLLASLAMRGCCWLPGSVTYTKLWTHLPSAQPSTTLRFRLVSQTKLLNVLGG